ncbi:MAG: DUF3891 family protein [Planctomycetota bacterium]|nr:DUF3891 family protein [Planctomycetota bacterium]
MLKTTSRDRVWFVTQPDHGQVAGYLAAHWGNGQFAKPGYYASVPDPERLRAEVILAIAQHDNGWWEWEATPGIADADGFPSGLAEVLKDQQQGMNRWRVGLARLGEHPYANLVMSHHAYWLYAAKVEPSPDPAFKHSLFWNRAPEELFPGTREADVEFIAELQSLRQRWIEELRADNSTASWIEPDSLNSHGRLLQLLDGLSLSLCSNLIPTRSGEVKGLGEHEFELQHVPRRSWDDRVPIDVSPSTERKIILDPYPFDLDPLPVNVPARVFELPADRSGHFQTWWNTRPVEMIEFLYTSG